MPGNPAFMPPPVLQRNMSQVICEIFLDLIGDCFAVGAILSDSCDFPATKKKKQGHAISIPSFATLSSYRKLLDYHLNVQEL